MAKSIDLQKRLGEIVTPESQAEIGLTLAITNPENYINPENSETKGKLISRQDFLDVIAQASAFQQYNEGRARLDEQLSGFAMEEKQGLLSESALYSAAAQIGLDKSYVKRALDLRISPDEALELLESVKAIPSFEIVKNTYQQVLLNALKSEFPFQEFGANCNDYPSSIEFYMIENKKIKTRGLLFFRTFFEKMMEREVLLAHLNLESLREIMKGERSIHNYEIMLYDTKFLKACKNSLERLDSYFREIYAYKNAPELKYIYTNDHNGLREKFAKK